jgi:hypothetical protein
VPAFEAERSGAGIYWHIQHRSDTRVAIFMAVGDCNVLWSGRGVLNF